MTCRNCWDPAERGKELCSWCAMTPEQRERRWRRDVRLIAISIVGFIVGIVLASLR